MAVGVTAFLFALSVPDELHPARRSSSWVFPDGIPHRWVAIAFDLAPYVIFCWMAFEAIRATKGRERLFMVGLLLSFMPSPLTTLRPQWAYQSEALSSLG